MKWLFGRPVHRSDPDTCSAIEPLLSLYSDGMASPQEVRRVEQHISGCEDCRRALYWMQATHLVIAERPATLPPPDMRARIARAIASSTPAPISVRTRPPLRRVALRPAVWAAAASIAILGFVAESLMKPQSPVYRPAPIAIGSPPNSQWSPRTLLLPVKRLARNTPSSVKTRVHSGTSLRVAQQRSTLPVTDNRTHLASSSGSRMAKAPVPNLTTALTEHLSIRPIPPTVKHTVPAPQIASRNTKSDSASHLVKVNPALVPVQEANVPKSLSGQDNGNAPPPVVVTPPSPTQNVVVAHNDVPFPSPSVHEDMLSSVKMRVASLNSISMAKKVYRDSNARVQMAVNTTGTEPDKFVLQPITYTPGFNSK